MEVEANQRNWTTRKLKEIATKITDGSHNPPKGIDSGILMLSAKNIANNRIEFENGRLISEEDFAIENRRTEIVPGDVLLTIVGSIGRSAVVPTNAPLFTLQRSVAVIKPTIDSKFLAYYLQNPVFQKSLTDEARGTAQKGVYLKTLNNLEISFPSVSEQQRIVAKIEELCSELDAGKQELEKAAQGLKVYRQAVLKWAFEGRLTNDVVDGELPDGWNRIPLSKVAKFINGDRGKNYPNRDEYVQEGIAFINTGHIEPTGKLSLDTMHYISREKFETLNSGKVKKGDLLYCLRGATLGKTAIVDQFETGAIASSLVIIRLNEQANNRYVFHFLKSPVGRELIHEHDNGSAQPNLSAKSVSQYTIPLPPLEEQHNIVQQIEARLSVCDKIEGSIVESRQQAEALRQSILKKAFEGKL